MMFPSDVEAVVVSMWQEVQQNLNYGFGGNGWRRRWSVVTALTASLCQSVYFPSVCILCVLNSHVVRVCVCYWVK
jgi:hypothetical protein